MQDWVAYGGGGVSGGQEARHGISGVPVGGHVPQSICAHDQDIIGAMLVVRQVVHLHLEEVRR